MGRLIPFAWISGMFAGSGDPRASIATLVVGLIWTTALRTRRVLR